MARGRIASRKKNRKAKWRYNVECRVKRFEFSYYQ
jgi:hypothetical protein